MARRLAIGLVLLLLGCARNPVTGRRQLSLVTQAQEIELGKQAAQEVSQTIGLHEDPKLAAYVERLGRELAAKSERPELPWTFQVVDDASVNAFALPGGPVFVTRGLLTYLDSEAELAAVIGHEIGHIAAKHSVTQLSRVQLAQLGLGLGVLIRPSLARYAQAAGVGLQLVFLKFGRDAELQADQLGFRYAANSGYDMREMSEVFATLDRVSQAGSRGRLPEWLSTHPNPENRVQRNEERVKSADVDWGKLAVRRDEYLAMVDGMVYGENPRQGFFQGNAFLHPELRFRIDFPQGWKTQNAPEAVTALSPGQDAIVQLAIAVQLTPEQAAQRFFAQEGVRQAVPTGSGAVPPSSSYFEAQTGEGVVHGLISFLGHGGRTFVVVGYTPAGQLGRYDAAFRQAIASFGPLTDPAALAVQPARVQLVKAPRDTTLAGFNSEFPSSLPLEELALLNGLEKDGPVRAGRLMKRVVGGPRR